MTNTQESPQHIFLFILDAVRQDHLSLYGYPRKTSPAIDEFAQQADVYNWAFAASTYTLVSVPSILSGKSPLELSNLFTSKTFDKEDFALLQDIRDKGYKTAFFTANIVTSSHASNMNDFFDVFWDELTEKELNREDSLFQTASTVLSAVKSYVSEHSQEKLFTVIHLMEAHGPYLPDMKSVFTDDEMYQQDKRQIKRVVNDVFAGVTIESLQSKLTAPAYQLFNIVHTPDGIIEDYNPYVRDYIAHYDMGIYQLKDFFAFLQKNNLYEEANIIITSDHGELMGEDNIFFAHGLYCHPGLTHVPLIIKHPHQREQHIIDANTSLLHIVPNAFGFESSALPISFHSKSIGFASEDYYYCIHNGDLHHEETFKENLFPTKRYSLLEVLENYTQLLVKPYCTVFNKQDGSLKKVELSQSKDIAEYVLYTLRSFFNIVKKIYISSLDTQETDLSNHLEQKEQQIQELATLERQLQKQLDETNNALSRVELENKQLHTQLGQTDEYAKGLEQSLNEIKNSKFFKIWQTYCKIRDRLL